MTTAHDIEQDYIAAKLKGELPVMYLEDDRWRQLQAAKSSPAEKVIQSLPYMNRVNYRYETFEEFKERTK